MLTVRARVVLGLLVLSIVGLGTAAWFFIEPAASDAHPLLAWRELGATVALAVPLTLVVLLGLRYRVGNKASAPPTLVTPGTLLRMLGLVIVLIVVIQFGVFLLLARSFNVDQTTAQVVSRACSISFGMIPWWI